MIEIRISSGTPEEEAQEFSEMFENKSVFDDVKALQEQVANMQEDITAIVDALEELQTSDVDIRTSIVDMQNDIRNINDRTADTGWIDLDLAEGIETYGPNTIPQYRKIGKIVAIRGAVTNVMASGTLVATLPKGYRPGKSYNCIQNTSMTDDTKVGTFARWKIAVNGQITIDAISENALYGEGKWFPLNTVFMID